MDEGATPTASDAERVAGTGDRRLSLALALVREAGRHARARAGRARVAWKGPGERVTDVDLAVQEHLVREIATGFPGDGLVAEEARHGSGLERAFVWVLDPLDGTNNYALGIPCFAVSVAVLRHGRPHAGVIHDPNTGFTCWALGGHGAYADGVRLALRGRELSDASNVSVRFPVSPGLRPLVHAWMTRYKFRAFGSVALHLAYAALGAVEVVVDDRAALWDIAAGAALLAEAGGALTAPDGRPLFPVAPVAYDGGPVPFVAGNRAAHAATLALLGGHGP